MNKAVQKLNTDLARLRHIAADEKKLGAAEKTAAATEKATLTKLAAQEKQIVDQFVSGSSSMTTDQMTKLLGQLVTIGTEEQQAKDAFSATMSKDKSALAKDKKAYAAERKVALKDLKPAEYHLSLKATNADRKELGLKALKAPVRQTSSSKGSSAYALARSLLGRNTQALKYSGPIAKYLDKWVSDHVCCANFVSACLEKEGLIKPSEHNDNVRGLAANLSRDSRWQRASTSHMQPGDVVCFEVPGEGHMAHVEMFAGYRNGRPYFIGSNNVNADGSQRISEGSPGYHIDAVYHYKG